MEQDSRKSIIQNATQKSGNHLNMFADLYSKACSYEVFKPQENGDILFIAMICRLSPEEKTIDTKGKLLEPDKLPMLNIYLMFLKKYAEHSGYKLCKACNTNVKTWVKCDESTYNQAYKKMQGFANVHYPQLIGIGENFNKLARETIKTLKLIEKFQ